MCVMCIMQNLGVCPGMLQADNRAATRIQACYRGYIVRSALHQVYAATRIQVCHGMS